MHPLLAQIRSQLPNETVSFGLLVRGDAVLDSACRTGLSWNSALSSLFELHPATAPRVNMRGATPLRPEGATEVSPGVLTLGLTFLCDVP